VEDLLRENKVTPDMEKEVGMTKQEMEQFVQRFKGAPKGKAAPGRDIEVKPERSKAIDSQTKGLSNRIQGTTRNFTERRGNSLPQDDTSGLTQGTRSQIPAEIRGRVDAYRSGISRERTSTSARSTGGEGGSR
jgi:hypothetical protein